MVCRRVAPRHVIGTAEPSANGQIEPLGLPAYLDGVGEKRGPHIGARGRTQGVIAMNRTHVFRGLIGLMTAVALSSGGPALAGAAGSPGSRSSAGVAVAGLSVAAVPARVAASACVAGAKACPIRIAFARGAYTGQAHAGRVPAVLEKR